MKEKVSFYKYKSLADYEFLLDMLLKERLYAASYHELNDPMEGVIKIDNTVPLGKESEWEKIIRGLKVSCFTRDRDNTLMWSHYADGGKGCLVEFELIGDQQYHKVCYLAKPTLTGKDINENKAIEILKYKEKPWKYEAEYRCILTGQNFLPVKIKSLTFGPRANKESVEMLRHILALCKPDLKVYSHNGIGVFHNKLSFITSSRNTFVKTLDPIECQTCVANKLIKRNFVGIHRNRENY